MKTCEFETLDGKICGSQEEIEFDPNLTKNLCKKHREPAAGPYGYAPLFTMEELKILNQS